MCDLTFTQVQMVKHTYAVRRVPCIVKEGDLHGVNVHICVRFGQDGHLSTFANIQSVPHHHHLWNNTQTQSPDSFAESDSNKKSHL